MSFEDVLVTVMRWATATEALAPRGRVGSGRGACDAAGRLDRPRPAPEPLAEATAALRWIRGGGCTLDAERAVEPLEHAGCTAVHVAQPTGPAPLELVLGQRPAA